MSNKDVSVTICTIGLVNTEHAITAFEGFKSGLVSTFTHFSFSPASPADTAIHIIKGGAQRWNTVVYPILHCTPFLTLYHFMPETAAAFVRYMWS